MSFMLQILMLCLSQVQLKIAFYRDISQHNFSTYWNLIAYLYKKNSLRISLLVLYKNCGSMENFSMWEWLLDYLINLHFEHVDLGV